MNQHELFILLLHLYYELDIAMEVNLENIYSMLRQTIDSLPLSTSSYSIEIGIILSTILSSELILRIPLAKTALCLTTYMRKSKKVLLSKYISDDWKEKILPIYAFRIFRSSLLLPLLLLVIFAPIFIVTALLAQSITIAEEHLTSVATLVMITFISILYLTIRLKIFHAKLL